MAVFNLLPKDARTIRAALANNCTRVYYRMNGEGNGLRVTHARTKNGQLELNIVGHGWATPYTADTICWQ